MLASSGIDSETEVKKIKLDNETKRLENLQDLLLDQTIDADDYKAMRSRYKSVIADLQDKLSSIKQTKNGYEKYLTSGPI